MPHHWTFWEARRPQVYYVHGTDLYFSFETCPLLVRRKPTHTLADLIGLLEDYHAFAADHEWDVDDVVWDIHRVMHRIIVHQGGAMVHGLHVWSNTYPESGEKEGWLTRDQYDDCYSGFQYDVAEDSIIKGSPEWDKAWRDMEERIARHHKYKYYQGWKPHFICDLKINLPIARDIKVAWTNPVPPPEAFFSKEEEPEMSPLIRTQKKRVFD
jgi:hypothetical protein